MSNLLDHVNRLNKAIVYWWQKDNVYWVSKELLVIWLLETRRLKLLTKFEELSMKDIHYVEKVWLFECKWESCEACQKFFQPTTRISCLVYDYQDDKVKLFLMNRMLFKDLQKLYVRNWYKIQNDLMIYRWWTKQETFYKVTSDVWTKFNDEHRKVVRQQWYDLDEALKLMKENYFSFLKQHFNS